MLTDELYEKIPLFHKCISRSLFSVKKSCEMAKISRREYQNNKDEIGVILNYFDFLDRESEIDIVKVLEDPKSLLKNSEDDESEPLVEVDFQEKPQNPQKPEESPDEYVKILKEDLDELISDSKEAEELREEIKILTGLVALAKTALVAFDSFKK